MTGTGAEAYLPIVLLFTCALFALFATACVFALKLLVTKLRHLFDRRTLADGRTQFRSEVYPAELRHLQARQRAAASARPTVADADGAPPVPLAARGLVGLAFSGGGIRSATFNLGILQGLLARNLFRHVDYLSTVSGGGFLGACVSALGSRPGADAAPPPLAHGREAAGGGVVAWLRDHCNFIAARGAIDWLRMLLVWGRGVALNGLVVLPLLFVLAAAVNFVHGDDLRAGHHHVVADPVELDSVLAKAAQAGERPVAPADLLRGFPELATGAAGRGVPCPGMLPSPTYYGEFISKQLRDEAVAAARARAEAGGSGHYDPREAGMIQLRSTALGEPVRDVLQDYVTTVLAGPGSGHKFRWDWFAAGPTGAGVGILAFLLVLAVLTAWGADEVVVDGGRVLRLSIRDGLLLFLAGSLAVSVAFLSPDRQVAQFPRVLVLLALLLFLPFLVRAMRKYVIRRRRPSSTLLRDRIEIATVYGLLGFAALSFVQLQRPMVDYFHFYAAPAILPALAALVPAAGGLYALLGGGRLPTRVLRLLALVIASVVVPFGLYLGFLGLCQVAVYHSTASSGRYWFGGTVIIVLALCEVARRLGANTSSVHVFARDRLAGTYLVREGSDGGIEPVHDLPLDEICPEGSSAPYHLVNTVLNLQGSDDSGLRGRNGDFFLFSKYAIGSDRTGYCTPYELEQLTTRPRLATAIAVSGAAAAPNMGTYTSSAVTALMTLLNVRMGYWLPHPGWVRSEGQALRHEGGERLRAGAAARARVHPSGNLLWRELLGRLDEKGPAVNVSDGGHIENLGAYELLRRRCKYIIAGDGEADPALNCGALATLLRYARLDLGIEIDIDLSALAPRADGFSSQHASLGRICYPATATQPAEEGYLLYLKSSLTGDEEPLIREYRASRPEFPHESTADQFFDERQFEVYRALGYPIVDGLFASVPAAAADDAPAATVLGRWFHDLEVRLAPTTTTLADLDVAVELQAVEEALAAPELQRLYFEIYPELRSGNPESPAAADHVPKFRAVLAVSGRMLRVMEQVVDERRLYEPRAQGHPANQGWMQTLRRWAGAPSFRRAYGICIGERSIRFRHFCEQVLGLRVEVTVGAPATDGRVVSVDVPGAAGRPFCIGRVVGTPARIELDPAWDDGAMRARVARALDGRS